MLFGGRHGRWSIVVAALAATFVVGCGENDAERVAAKIEALQTDLAAGDVAAVCANLAARPQRQIGSVGHDRRPTTCERDLRAFVKQLRTGAELTGAEPFDPRRLRRPQLVRVDVDGDRALARMRLDGQPLDVPFVEEEGRWKLDDLFVVTGPVKPYLD